MESMAAPEDGLLRDLFDRSRGTVGQKAAPSMLAELFVTDGSHSDQNGPAGISETHRIAVTPSRTTIERDGD